ncbi:hypothetical protein MRX96_050048 [Rhipicephalus microplus]
MSSEKRKTRDEEGEREGHRMTYAENIGECGSRSRVQGEALSGRRDEGEATIRATAAAICLGKEPRHEPPGGCNGSSRSSGVVRENASPRRNAGRPIFGDAL